MEKIFELYEQGCYQEVIRSIDLGKFSAIGDPALAHVLAASYFQLGLYSESLPLLKEVESCFLADPHYLSLYGACLRRCGELDDARFRLEQALSVQPDNAAIRNNFANLLIDLKDYDQAESILDQLLSDNPDYQDAQVNLHRLKQRKQIQQLQSENDTTADSSRWCLADPLMLAFGEDEVERTRPKQVKSAQVQSELKEKLPCLKQQQIGAEQLSLALEAVQEGRHTFALQLCSQVHQVMPTSPTLFECISDAYIALQRFGDAEICLLHSLQLGGKSFKLFANLTSLLCIRGDFTLAQHYLEQASLLDEVNPLLSSLRSQIAQSQDGKNASIVRFDHEWILPKLKRKES